MPPHVCREVVDLHGAVTDAAAFVLLAYVEAERFDARHR
jgi:hypothetical protein